jgi:hypothetical protein
MIVYWVWGFFGDVLILETDDPITAEVYQSKGFEVTAVSVN